MKHPVNTNNDKLNVIVVNYFLVHPVNTTEDGKLRVYEYLISCKVQHNSNTNSRFNILLHFH